jgi:branched-chain amino acid transport system substrate-binding protein
MALSGIDSKAFLRAVLFCMAAVFWGNLFQPAMAPALPQKSGPVRLAVIMAATGIAVDSDLPAIDAARLAVEDINGQGGVLGRPVEMLLLDNHSSVLHSKVAAQKAVSLGVAGVIGAIWSSHSQVVAEVAQNAEIPMITPASTHPDIARTGDFIFRTCPINSIQGRIMADFAYRDLGIKTAVVVRNLSESYSMTLADHFVSNFEGFGGRIAWQGKYKGTATGFRDMLEQVRRIGPDAVFIPGYARDSGLLIRQAVNMGIRPIFLGGDAWESAVLEYGKSAMEGSYCASLWDPTARTAAAGRFKKRYLNKTGRQAVAPQAVMTYDAIMLMADAISRAKSTTPKEIRDSLARTGAFGGIAGTIAFDAHGDLVLAEMPILTYRQGRLVFVKNVRLPQAMGR